MERLGPPLHGCNHAFCDHVTAHDAAKDVYKDTFDVWI